MDTYSTNTPWESRFGYSRALRAGAMVFVNGTVATNDDGSPHAPGDTGAQTVRCFEIIDRALAHFGLDRSAVVRVRVYVTDVADAEAVGGAFATYFGAAGHRPCMTLVGVAALISPEYVVEIEAEAIDERDE